MTEKMTSITLPSGKDPGYMNYGDRTAADMIADYRRMAQSKLKEAQEVLAASDSDFRIAVVRGTHRQQPIRVIQEGRDHTPDCRCIRCVKARAAQ